MINHFGWNVYAFGHHYGKISTISERKLYADYLQIPYQEDIVLFRSNSSRIGDENFLSKLVSIGKRIKLRPGRPSKPEIN